MRTSLLGCFNKLQMDAVGINEQDDLLTVFLIELIFRFFANGLVISLKDWEIQRMGVWRQMCSFFHHCPMSPLSATIPYL